MSALEQQHEPDAFITFYLGRQMFAMALDHVRDVIKHTAPLVTIPHAPAMVKGALAVREHVALAIDLRARLGLPSGPPGPMMLVVEHKGEWYTLLVDRIDDVAYYQVEATGGIAIASDPLWNQVIAGIITRQGQRVVVLDIAGIVENAAH